MIAEIIAVGTELSTGRTLNTNARYLAGQLLKLGIECHYQTVVDDNEAHLRKALAAATARSHIIILSGGLGPTEDDLTKEVVCSAIGEELVVHEESRARIQAYFQRTGRTMTENNLKQALLPKDAVVFPNDYGTAPGFALVAAKQSIILLPGPPRELMPMYENYVEKFLMRYSDGVIVSHSLNIFGIGEAQVADLLTGILGGENPYAALYAKDGEVEMRVTAHAATRQEANALCRPVLTKACDLLGENVYGIDKDNLEQVVVGLLKQHNLSVSTAESCTAGLLSKRITDIPGSSEVFALGITAYANDIKSTLLDVPAELIEQYGAVSPEVAKAMAIGVRRKSGSNLGIAITGIAGPGGGTAEKPVGLVYLAMCDERNIWAKRLMLGHGSAERDYIRHLSASGALNLLRLYLEIYPEQMAEGTSLEAAHAAHAAHTLPLVPDIPEPPVEEKLEGEGTFSDKFSEDALAGNTIAFMPASQAEASLRSFDSETSQDNDVNFDDNFILKQPGAPVSFQEEEFAEEPDESPWYMKFARYILPWKGDPVGEMVRKIVFLAAMIGLIVSSAITIPYFFDTFSAQKNMDDERGQLGASYVVPDGVTLPVGINQKFGALWLQNNDTIGWIKVNNTKTDNVVVQTDNNDYYIDYGFNKKKNRYGTIFVDYRCKVSLEGNSQNLIIYGHNMKNGTMFGELRKYMQLSFYKKNPTITFDTLYQDNTYKVFAAFITNTDPSQDNGYAFNYRPVDFRSQDDFMAFVTQARRRSLFISPVDVQPNDEIITLSTCTYELKDARFVVMARKVRDGESSDVNISEAKNNPNVLYPQALHDKKGTSKPVFGDESSSTSSQSTVTSYPSFNSSSTSVSSGSTSSGASSASSSSVSSKPSSSSKTSSGSTSSKNSSSKPNTSSSNSSSSSVSSSSSSEASSTVSSEAPSESSTPDESSEEPSGE